MVALPAAPLYCRSVAVMVRQLLSMLEVARTLLGMSVRQSYSMDVRTSTASVPRCTLGCQPIQTNACCPNPIVVVTSKGPLPAGKSNLQFLISAVQGVIVID